MKNLVVLTGAGISAESGLKTFRDSGGLWEGHDVMEVASPEGWAKDPGMVLEFYNQRRKQALVAKPNRGHKILAELEAYFNVIIVTQNVDNLHEQAGSTNVIHLHGNLFQSRSTIDPTLIHDMKTDTINLGEKCEKGSQLRPNIVWFGEMVPEMENAAMEAQKAEIFLIVGTSMVVYPAAGLIKYVKDDVPKYVVDPNIPDLPSHPSIHYFEEKASTGLALVKQKLLSELPGNSQNILEF